MKELELLQRQLKIEQDKNAELERKLRDAQARIKYLESGCDPKSIPYPTNEKDGKDFVLGLLSQC